MLLTQKITQIKFEDIEFSFLIDEFLLFSFVTFSDKHGCFKKI